MTFEGVAATNVNVISDTMITCTTPAGAGQADMAVTNSDGQTGTALSAFSYVPGPTVAGVNPLSGPAAGGTAVTVSGTGFLTGAGVTIGGAPATNVNVISDTMITCTTPPGAGGLADVVVTNADGQADTVANAFTFILAPTVTGVNPVSGPAAGGTPIVVSGTGFQTGASVTFEGAAATNVNVISDTMITCTTPAGVGPADVVVTNPDGQASTDLSAFSYVPGPTVTGVNPVSGPAAGSTAVIVSGTGFMLGASVTFEGVAATNVNVHSDTMITCTTPAGAGSADVEVTNPDGQTSTDLSAFSYVPGPTVAGVNPALGPTDGGTPVVVSGTGFLSGATVTFGGTAASNVNVINDTTLTCTTPSGTAGMADVVIANPDGQSATAAGAFTFLERGPGG